MIQVNVTPRDIKDAVRGCAHSCPIALALGRQHGMTVETEFNVPKAAVFSGVARLGETCYKLPKEALEFVNKYDSLETVEPISFWLIDIVPHPQVA
jgi:hypothetical protein